MAQKYSINPKTVAKWKKRQILTDAPMGPKNAKSTVLTTEEEALCIAFRKTTLVALDDCLYSLQQFQICLVTLETPCIQKKFFVDIFYKILIVLRFISISYLELLGKLYLFVAIDRTSKFVYVELLKKYGKIESAQFLQNLIKTVPYKIHTILTDNGIQFTNHERHKHALSHIFDRICVENNIEHRLTKVNHPWTNG